MTQDEYKCILSIVEQLNDLDEHVEQLQKVSDELQDVSSELKSLWSKRILFSTYFPVVMMTGIVIAYFIIERLFFA